MKTKSLLAVLALGVVVMLSGCSSDDASTSDDPPYIPSRPDTWLIYKGLSAVTRVTDPEGQGKQRTIVIRIVNRHSARVTAGKFSITIGDVTVDNIEFTSNSSAVVGHIGYFDIVLKDPTLLAAINENNGNAADDAVVKNADLNELDSATTVTNLTVTSPLPPDPTN